MLRGQDSRAGEGESAGSYIRAPPTTSEDTASTCIQGVLEDRLNGRGHGPMRNYRSINVDKPTCAQFVPQSRTLYRLFRTDVSQFSWKNKQGWNQQTWRNGWKQS